MSFIANKQNCQDMEPLDILRRLMKDMGLEMGQLLKTKTFRVINSSQETVKSPNLFGFISICFYLISGIDINLDLAVSQDGYGKEVLEVLSKKGNYIVFHNEEMGQEMDVAEVLKRVLDREIANSVRPRLRRFYGGNVI